MRCLGARPGRFVRVAEVQPALLCISPGLSVGFPCLAIGEFSQISQRAKSAFREQLQHQYRTVELNIRADVFSGAETLSPCWKVTSMFPALWKQ